MTHNSTTSSTCICIYPNAIFAWDSIFAVKYASVKKCKNCAPQNVGAIQYSSYAQYPFCSTENSLSRQKTCVWRVQVPQVQPDVGQWQQLGQCWAGVPELPDHGLSIPPTRFGKACWRRLWEGLEQAPYQRDVWEVQAAGKRLQQGELQKEVVDGCNKEKKFVN